MANEYIIGKVVRLAFVVTVAGAATDPTAPTFSMKDPDSLVTTYVYPTHPQLVKDSTGNYHVDWSCSKVGPHFYRFSGTGTGAGAEESLFQVKASSVI